MPKSGDFEQSKFTVQSHEVRQEDTMSEIDIKDLDKAAVLAALFNTSRPQGIGFTRYDPKPMSVEAARGVLDQAGPRPTSITCKAAS